MTTTCISLLGYQHRMGSSGGEGVPQFCDHCLELVYTVPIAYPLRSCGMLKAIVVKRQVGSMLGGLCTKVKFAVMLMNNFDGSEACRGLAGAGGGGRPLTEV